MKYEQKNSTHGLSKIFLHHLHLWTHLCPCGLLVCSCLHNFRFYLECEHTCSFTHTYTRCRSHLSRRSRSLFVSHTHTHSSSLLTYTLVLTPTPFFLSLFLGNGGIRAASRLPALLSSFPSYPTVPSSLSHPLSPSPAWPLKLIF